MKNKKICTLITALFITALTATTAFGVEKSPKIIEEDREFMGFKVRIQVPVTPDQKEEAVRSAINRTFAVSKAPEASEVSAGKAIDNIVASLKSAGVNNAFVFSNDEMYCLGVKTDKEMWKGWIPHPTDKKKVFAILRLKDKAIATVHSGLVSASVVGDDAASAEKTAIDLLAKGPAGIKAADEAGIDAMVVVKEGNKLNAAMAGGFKEQYDKVKKK